MLVAAGTLMLCSVSEASMTFLSASCHTRRPRTRGWGAFCQGCLRGPYPFFLSLSFFVRPAQHVSSSRPTMGWGRRAQEPSRMARERATAKGLVLDGSEHDGTVAVVGDDDIEGSPRMVHEGSCHILVFGGCRNPTMMQ